MEPSMQSLASPAAPSPLVRIVFAPLTRLLNPLIRGVAGRRHVGVVAQIPPQGRRSGRAYVTPAGARLVGDVFFIPLTFGTRSDWYRNVRAAGGCVIRWQGIDYQTNAPRVLGAGTAL